MQLSDLLPPLPQVLDQSCAVDFNKWSSHTQSHILTFAISLTSSTWFTLAPPLRSTWTASLLPLALATRRAV